MDTMELDPSPAPPSRASPNKSRKANLSLDLSNISQKAERPTKALIFKKPSNEEPENKILEKTEKKKLEEPDQCDDLLSDENRHKLKEWMKKHMKKHKDEAKVETETDTEMEPIITRIAPTDRFVVSFKDVATAKAMRECWEKAKDSGERPERFPDCVVSYGIDCEISSDRYLPLPDAGQLWFISPPPSPPHGWASRREDPPNTMVHARDVEKALELLRAGSSPTTEGIPTPVSPADSKMGEFRSGQRSRSSTLIFQPRPQMGDGPDIPCVIVDDMTDEPLEMSPPSGEPKKRPITHTMRPGLELMHHA